jgi:AraC family transcriptional regulator
VVEPAEEKQMIKPEAAVRRTKISTNGSKKRHPSRWSRITVFDTNGARAPLFPSGEPLLTSAGRAWTGITVEGHRLPPIEFPERTADSHLIAVHFRPAKLVWFLGGHAQTSIMKRGSLDIVPQGTLLGGYSKDETEFLMLALDPWLVERVASDLGAANHVELIRKLGIRDLQIEHICMAFKLELEADCPSGRLYGDALAVALAAHLLARYATHVVSAPGHHAGLPACKLRRVVEYINDNLTEDLTLAEIAHVAGMNPHYFSRAFKQATGTPPHRFVTNCRVEKAKRLLAEDELPLVEIGLSVGFQNQSHFTTLFHKLTGLTPKAYREGH